MKKNKMYLKLCTSLIIFSIIFSYFSPFAYADSTIPDGIRVVTDEAEKEKLLGITVEEARRKNILGLAGEFSVFTKDGITFTGADTEGRIATGGYISAGTSYKYHAGTEVTNDDVAKIITKKGFSNMELSYTQHYTLNKAETRAMATYNTNVDYDKKKIAAIGTDTTSMNWNSVEEWNKKQIVVADLIDFDSEFEWLQNKSNELANMEANGEIIYGYILGGKYTAKQAVIFKGDREDINVFTLTAAEYNNLFKTERQSPLVPKQDKSNNIIFDVPEGSQIIINITTGSGVYFYENGGDGVSYNPIVKSALYTRATDRDIALAAKNQENSGELSYSLEGTLFYAHDGTDFIRDESGNIKTYKVEFNKEQRNTFYSDFADRLLYNIPESSSICLCDNMIGSILAPKAYAYEATNYGQTVNKGFLYGTLVAKSYYGDRQFRLARTHHIPIRKIFNENEPLNEAAFRITDEKGNEVYNWTINSTHTEFVDLKSGTYTLEEVVVPDNFEIPSVTKTTFNVRDTDSSPFFIVSNVELEPTINRREKKFNDEIDYNEAIRTVTNLKTQINDNNKYYVKELKFEINTDITDDLFYVVASNGNGFGWTEVDGSDTRTGVIDALDWIEFKKWTNVKDGITVEVPASSTAIYNNTGDQNVIAGTRIHFYVEDANEPTGAREVTDQVEITSVTAVYLYSSYYTTKEVYQTPENVTYTNSSGIQITNNPIVTNLEITKQDSDTEELLSGAEYTIENENGETIKEIKFGEKTKVLLENVTELIPGTYYLVEQKAPIGYRKSTEKVPFTVKPNTSETIKITLKDEKIKANVIKKDEFGNVLAGATIGVYDSEGTPIMDSFESGEEPYLLSELATKNPGKYTIKEIAVPQGYVKADDVEIELTSDGKILVNNEETTDIVMTDNILKGTIRITKQGEVLKNTEESEKFEKFRTYRLLYQLGVLQGAEFELYAKDDVVLNGTKIYEKDQKVGEATTAVDGIAMFENLPMGDYYILEKNAPEGYELNTEKLEISLTPVYENTTTQILSATKNIENERIKKTITIKKLEKGTTKPVAGAIYGLYNKDEIGNIEANTLLDVTRTEEDGTGNFEVELPMGNYYVKELEAPKGYTVTVENEEFNLNEDSKTNIDVEEDYTKVKIKKVDEEGKYVKGATLAIKDKNGEIVETWETEETEHVINAKLIAGEKYSLEETKVPEGYEKAEVVEFTVSMDGKEDSVEIVNNKIKEEEPKEEEPKEEEPKEEEPKEEQPKEEEPKEEEPKEEEPKEEELKEEEPKEEQKSEEATTEEPKTVQTGDVIRIVFAGMLMAVIVCGVTFIRRKK